MSEQKERRRGERVLTTTAVARRGMVLESKDVELFDISIGGLSFYSETAIEVGSQKSLIYHNLKLQIEVLACDLEEIDASTMTFGYKIRAKFDYDDDSPTRGLVARILRLEDGGLSESD